jgi:hypothetical protein
MRGESEESARAGLKHIKKKQDEEKKKKKNQKHK